ncbi:MAG: hypothetical protein IJT91_08605 [Clostridia bacterium]|nr:hypothetical protein [Clostridia bacterium]
MKYALIDIGSNTIKIDIFSIDENRRAVLEYHKPRHSRLVSHIKNGSIDPEGLKELIEAVIEFRATAEDRGCDKIFCFATAAMRKLKDFPTLHDTVLAVTGIDIDLIPGNREAELSFNGMLAEQPAIDEGLMIDMGGGSTELVRFRERRIKTAVSYNFGCLSLADNYAPENYFTDGSESNIRFYVGDMLSSSGQDITSDTAVLVGGTAKAAAKLNRELASGGDILTAEEFENLFALLKTTAGTLRLYELIPKRAPTVLPGMTAFSEIFITARIKKIVLSDGGVRRGYLVDKVGI